MSDYTREYYLERSRASRAMAAAATKPNIAAIHLDLARRYEAIASTKPDGGAAGPAPVEASTWGPALQAAAG